MRRDRKTLFVFKSVLILFLTQMICSVGAMAQVELKNPNATIKAMISEAGIISDLQLNVLDAKAHTIKFRADSLAGPTLLLNGKTIALKPTNIAYKYQAEIDGIYFGISYRVDANKIGVIVEAKNTSNKTIKNVDLALRFGLSTEMVKYPEWRKDFFPTLLRAEKTHFWGYLMSPNARIITVSSPDPIASYKLYYNNSNLFGHGHLIRTFALDLLKNGPLPERHPQDLCSLKPLESKTWTILLEEASELKDVNEIVARNTKAPSIQATQYTIHRGESTQVSIHSASKPEITILSPDGNKAVEKKIIKKGSLYTFDFSPLQDGIYTILVKDLRTYRISEAKISVLRNTYSDYILSARRAAIKYPQQASSHTESWYGLFSGYIAQEYFPNTKWDNLIDEKLEEIYPLLYDTITNVPTYFMERIQNHALMAALYAQKYKASGQIKDLQRAADLADYILSKQVPEGPFKSGRTHYTSVIYIAKALMDVMALEKVLAEKSDAWNYRYNRHYHAVKKSIDELANNLDNIQTEGEMTFEDGMISCSYTQISQFALLMPKESKDRVKYTYAAAKLADMHQCLSQLVIPDSRMHGGSMRYWEAQYDILSGPNMMNSPHGWSAWRIYGLKNLYELTGNTKYLDQMMNAIGTCIQLLNPENDHLNWAFIVDPYIEADLFVESKETQGKGVYEKKIVGEQYLPMISDWNKPQLNTRVSGYWGYDGGKCDNDVHEIFKCLGEILLTNCYVYEKSDGSIVAYNCKVKKTNDTIEVVANESIIENLHYNLKTISTLKFKGNSKDVATDKISWIKAE